MSTVDVRNDGPLTLESLMLSVQLAGNPKDAEVLLTHGQMADVYSELQSKVRFADTGKMLAFGMRLTPMEA